MLVKTLKNTLMYQMGTVLGIENNHTVFSEMRFSFASSDRGAGDAFEPVRGFLSYCFSLILSLCSPLAAEVGLQHCGHREGKDQTDSVWSGAARPVGPDKLSQEVSLTGNELPSSRNQSNSRYDPRDMQGGDMAQKGHWIEINERIL